MIDTLVIQILNIFIGFQIFLVPTRSFLDSSEARHCRHQNDGLSLRLLNVLAFYIDSLHTRGLYLKIISAPLGET